MSSYYSSASFVKMYDIGKNLTRIVDLVKSPGVDGIKNPDIFYYEYLATNSFVGYNLPAEGFNHSKIVDTLTTLIPNSSRDDLF
jgi:hypothetical protein